MNPRRFFQKEQIAQPIAPVNSSDTTTMRTMQPAERPEYLVRHVPSRRSQSSLQVRQKIEEEQVRQPVISELQVRQSPLETAQELEVQVRQGQGSVQVAQLSGQSSQIPLLLQQDPEQLVHWLGPLQTAQGLPQLEHEPWLLQYPTAQVVQLSAEEQALHCEEQARHVWFGLRKQPCWQELQELRLLHVMHPVGQATQAFPSGKYPKAQVMQVSALVQFTQFGSQAAQPLPVTQYPTGHCRQTF